MIKNSLQKVCKKYALFCRKPQVNRRQMFLRLLFLAAALALSTHQLSAQQPSIVYLYDDLGRLMRVVNESNECATYQYDAVGNILSIIRNSQCLQPPTIASLFPDSAKAGTAVCIAITGINFLGANLMTDNPEVKINRLRVSEATIDACLDISFFSLTGPTKIIVATPAGSADRAFTVDPKAVVITEDTLIDEDNKQFENATVEVSGKTLVVNGSHTFGSLILKNGAVLTHSPTTATKVNKLDITVTGTIQVDVTSRIDVAARGFLGGNQPGNPFGGSGMTVGFQRGSTGGSGGSYGGLGGAAESGVSNQVYGDFRNPNEPGSGAGGAIVSAANGGGLIRIVAQTFQLDGVLKADGGIGSSTCCFSGGGSGGGIRIDAGMLRGTGTISANGGSGLRTGAGGGGGRVAIYYQNATGFDFSRVNAFGGTGASGAPNGAAGTVYLQGPGREGGELLVDNNNVAVSTLTTPIPNPSSGTILLTHLRVRRQGHVRVDSLLNLTGTLEISSGAEFISTSRTVAGALNLTNSSLITYFPATADAFFKVDLAVDTLTVDATSRIDVAALGFLGGNQPGNPFGGSGMTVGFQRGSTGGSGGSYGGLGGAAEGGVSNQVYGDFRNPNEPGSGAGGAIVPAANGGGLIRIVAQTFQLDGVLKADGGIGSSTCCFSGGGSGGGIRIDAGMLRGTGTISANGGSGLRTGAGGGGGRVAIYYQNATGFDFSRVNAFGGTGASGAPNGQNGTVFTEQTLAMWTPSGSEAPVMKTEVQENEAVQLAYDNSSFIRRASSLPGKLSDFKEPIANMRRLHRLSALNKESSVLLDLSTKNSELKLTAVSLLRQGEQIGSGFDNVR